MRRVVITGMGAYSPIGTDYETIMQSLKAQKNSTVVWDELATYKNLNSQLVCPVTTELPNYPRKKTRAMGRVGRLATAATEKALADAGLLDSEVLHNGRTGVAYGSCGGSSEAMRDVADFTLEKDVSYLNATTYVAIMPHTVAVNLSIFYGIHGRVIATSTACTSGSQAIGYAYESIKSGVQDVMVAGGAEELSPFAVGVFDALFATSQSNSDPNSTPRPFDISRDGIVVGEGAGTLILEEYEHAIARGAKIYAEIVGVATNCDATHITNPSTIDMEQCMRLALADAGIKPESIGYLNAHGTGTVNGDIAEGSATFRLFGDRVPVATLKSYMGHTLGAAGALESIISIYMQRANWFAPNLNLVQPDENCGKLNLINGSGLNLSCEYIMSNNFAFGGVNTSLIFKRVD
jgi:3-oxoacyl-[acyl-carrier-protein] synthase II